MLLQAKDLAAVETADRAIRRLLSNPDLRIQMGVAGMQRVADHFTIQHTARNVARIYLELLTRKNQSNQL